MTLTEKKRRAAVIAVSSYAQLETNPNKIAEGEGAWGKMGIKRIMNDREMLQRKGKTPGFKPFQ